MKKCFRSVAPTRRNPRASTDETQEREVTVNRKESINLEEREYGLIRANQKGTPYPRKSMPVDAVALMARLEDQKKREERTSIDSRGASEQVKFLCPYRNPATARLKAFAMRRKRFDDGEFTICKGRKTTDEFHPSVPIARMREDSIIRHTQAFIDMADYCRQNNFQIVEKEPVAMV